MNGIYYGNELYHHGILGQKWGVRRFQNEDGTLTARGEKRYDVGDGLPGKQTEQKRGKKVALKDIDKQPEVKGHRNKLIAKYKSQGMTQAEAEAAAEKRIKTEKDVAIGVGAAAAIAIAAGAFYMHNKKAYTNSMTQILGEKAKDAMNSPEVKAADQELKHFSSLGLSSIEAKNLSQKGEQYLKDSKINFKDIPLHRVVNAGETLDGKHAAYISFGDDSKKYRALYGGMQMAQLGGKPVELSFNAKRNVHLAGKSTAQNAFKELLKNDKTFGENVRAVNDSKANNVMMKLVNPHAAAVHDAAYQSLKSLQTGNSISDKEWSNLYKSFNVNLVDHTDAGNSVADTFYNKLKSLGFHAIEDVNDKEYSGYKSKHPLIVFDWSAFDLDNIKSETLNIEEEQKIAEQILKQLGYR